MQTRVFCIIDYSIARVLEASVYDVVNACLCLPSVRAEALKLARAEKTSVKYDWKIFRSFLFLLSR